MGTSHVGKLTIPVSPKRSARMADGINKKFENHRRAMGLRFARVNSVTYNGLLPRRSQLVWCDSLARLGVDRADQRLQPAPE
jgi:hypothetical protein